MSSVKINVKMINIYHTLNLMFNIKNTKIWMLQLCTMSMCEEKY